MLCLETVLQAEIATAMRLLGAGTISDLRPSCSYEEGEYKMDAPYGVQERALACG
ncbi:hypothetical protein MY10362_004985, partial [Beauveria mimosiformis]